MCIDANPPWHEGVRKISLIRLDAIGYGVLAVYVCKAYALGLQPRRWLAAAGALGLVVAWLVYLATAIDTSLVARTLLFAIVSASFAALLPLAACGVSRHGHARSLRCASSRYGPTRST
jgi:hypothetical protein